MSVSLRCGQNKCDALNMSVSWRVCCQLSQAFMQNWLHPYWYASMEAKLACAMHRPIARNYGYVEAVYSLASSGNRPLSVASRSLSGEVT